MVEDIRAKIVVKLANGPELAKEVSQAFSKGAEAAFDTSSTHRTATKAEQTAALLDVSRERQTNADRAARLMNQAKSLKDTIIGAYNRKDPEFDEKNRKTRTYMQVASSGVSAINSILKGFTGASLNLLTSIYDRMRAASPLLQAIESLFQLALTLFFMPLGNKIAEVMLPAVLKLLDGVMGMWSMFEGKSLGEIFSIALTQGMLLLGTYFKEIGSDLKEQDGILGSIGTMLVSIGDFILESGEGLMTTLFNIAGWVVEHMKGIISAIVTLTGIHYSLMLAQIGATVASSVPFLGTLIGGVAAVGLAASPVVGGLTHSALSGNDVFLAEGGYVPATEGGSLHVLGEGGEGEYVVPESKLGRMGGNITNNFYIEGVTSEELGRMIDERVNEQISLSRIRSGF